MQAAQRVHGRGQFLGKFADSQLHGASFAQHVTRRTHSARMYMLVHYQ